MNSKLLELVKTQVIPWNEFKEMLCAYNTAMAKCQAEIGSIKKTAKGQFTYAPYEVIREQTAKTIADNGFSVEQSHVKRNDEYFLITLVKHKDGYEEEKVTPMPINESNRSRQSAEQVVGSALSYAKRYVYNSIFGIATYDKDPDEGDEHDDKDNDKNIEEKPLCPKCNKKMVSRKSRDNRSFWGCINYPKCDGLRPII